MQDITLARAKLDLKQFALRKAADTDVSRVLDHEFRLYDDATGALVAMYVTPKKEEPAFNALYEACAGIKYQTTYRTAGLKTTSRIFGYNPRNSIRKDFCSATSLASEQPARHQQVLLGGSLAAKYYALHNPDLYAEHLATTQEKVVADFRYDDVPFTSGIINENNPLAYHFDGGNFQNVWSAMIVFKKGITGGHLAMPEYNVAVKCADNSIFYFDGQGILHGVTPFKRMFIGAKRYSIVYYSLRQLWNCEPLRDEIARARMRRQTIENKLERKGRTKAKK